MFQIKKRSRTVQAWVYGTISILGVIGAFWFGYAVKPQETKSFFATAIIDEDGSTFIREIIDTDFGGTDQRGIYRDIPDVERIDYVHSPYAPDLRRVLSRGEKAEFGGRCVIGQRWTCLRIGRPDINNYGLHRYIIDYQLVSGTLLGENQCGLSGDTICWNAIPERWEWDIKSATIQIQYPYILNNITCGEIRGSVSESEATSNVDCDITQSGNTVTITTKNINSRTGFFVAAQRTNTPTTENSDFLPPPKAPTSNDGRYPFWNNITNVILGLILAILGKVGTTRLLLYRGRDIVRSGGATEAAFAETNDGPTKSLSNADMNRLVTLSVVPPDNITPYHGAILINEEVNREAKQAWFLQQVSDGKVEIINKEGSRFKYVSPNPPESQPLKVIFGPNAAENQPTLDLKKIGEHTKTLRTKTDFEEGWRELGEELKDWHEHSNLWFHKKPAFGPQLGAGISIALLFGLACIIGFFPTLIGLFFCVLYGAFIAYVYRGWELAVRTPVGSGLWIQIQGFKKFIKTSEAKHVEQAAQDGTLRLYTAWAVALGEIKHWNKILNSYKQNSASLDDGYDDVFFFVAAAHAFDSHIPVNFGGDIGFVPDFGGGFGGGGDGGGGGGGGGGGW